MQNSIIIRPVLKLCLGCHNNLKLQKNNIMNTTQKERTARFVFCILFLVFALAAVAQDQKAISKLYLQTSAGGGSYKSDHYEIGLQAIFKNKWSGTLSYQEVNMRPKNMPADYQAETGYVLFFPYTYEAEATMKSVSLTAGRYFKLGKNTWATTEGGLSYVNGEKVNFQRTEITSTNILFAASTSSNYNTTKEKTSTVGAMLRADVNWAFASFMGIGAGVYANINSIQSPVGFHLKLIVGKMGREKKNRKNFSGL